jgi:hypothetical protein
VAAKKRYYPHRVSRNERLAFQLTSDRKVKIVDFRHTRRQHGHNITRGERLADFLIQKKIKYPLLKFHLETRKIF